MTSNLLFLKKAEAEITSLRAENKLMQARLSMFDEMIALFKADSGLWRGGMTKGPDTLFDIRNRIYELETEKSQPVVKVKRQYRRRK